MVLSATWKMVPMRLLRACAHNSRGLNVRQVCVAELGERGDGRLWARDEGRGILDLERDARVVDGGGAIFVQNIDSSAGGAWRQGQRQSRTGRRGDCICAPEGNTSEHKCKREPE